MTSTTSMTSTGAELPAERRGMTAFLVVWAGQVVSVLGSYLTGFALAVWIYQQTGSATLFALITLVTTVPGMLLLPFAGALVDRWDRRRAMIVSDAGAGIATLALALLIWRGRLDLWQIYVLMAVISTFSALRWPAFTAATTMLVPRQHLGRAAGLNQLGEAAAQILSPLLAGALVVTIGRQGVVLIDFASYLFAIATLLVVRIPRPPATGVRRPSEGVAVAGSPLRLVVHPRAPGPAGRPDALRRHQLGNGAGAGAALADDPLLRLPPPCSAGCSRWRAAACWSAAWL